MVSPNISQNGVPLRIFSPGYDSYVIENPTVMKWMAENNIEYNHSLFPNEMTDPTAIAARMAKLQTVLDYGIPVWIDFETCFENAYGNFTESPNTQAFTDTTETTTSYGYPIGTPLPSWETMFGAAVDEYNTLDIEGFNAEGGFDNGLIWITTKEHAVGKKFLWYCVGGSELAGYSNPTPPAINTPWPLTGPYNWYTSHDLGWWVSHIDELVWECYCVNVLGYTNPAVTWVNENCSIPQGVVTAFGVPPDTTTWWSEYLYGNGNAYPYNPTLPLVQQRIQAARSLNAIKEVIGHFDVVEILASDPTVANNTIQEQGEFIMNLNLAALGTQPVSAMQQTGFTPNYNGASTCDHINSCPPDTFVNTGNEIIMLKSTSSSSHTITVTGTSATENYTITISPTTPTFLGPYPIAEFGALPTITYDNSNLYVSIVKDIPV